MTEDLRNRIDGMIKSMHLLRTESGTVEFDKLFNEVRELATTSEERREAGLYLREQMRMRRKRSDIDIKKNSQGSARCRFFIVYCKTIF